MQTVGHLRIHDSSTWAATKTGVISSTAARASGHAIWASSAITPRATHPATTTPVATTQLVDIRTAMCLVMLQEMHLVADIRMAAIHTTMATSGTAVKSAHKSTKAFGCTLVCPAKFDGTFLLFCALKPWQSTRPIP